jgi:hypothetical protein
MTLPLDLVPYCYYDNYVDQSMIKLIIDLLCYPNTRMQGSHLLCFMLYSKFSAILWGGCYVILYQLLQLEATDKLH